MTCGSGVANLGWLKLTSRPSSHSVQNALGCTMQTGVHTVQAHLEKLEWCQGVAVKEHDQAEPHALTCLQAPGTSH